MFLTEQHYKILCEIKKIRSGNDLFVRRGVRATIFTKPAVIRDLFDIQKFVGACLKGNAPQNTSASLEFRYMALQVHHLERMAISFGTILV